MRKKPTYTEKVHARRLLNCLKSSRVCDNFCPAARRYDPESPYVEMWNENSHPCKICTGFVGLGDWEYNCPCDLMEDKEKVIQISWKALRDKGYL